MDVDPRWQLLFRKKIEYEIVESFRFLRQLGIEPILIKGWAAGRLYPEAEPRNFHDIDLAVSSDQYTAARKALRTETGSKLPVDLHNEFRRLDTRSWNDIFDDSEIVPLNGSEVRIPSPEDHLRIMCVHWLNDGGVDKERLSDIYYAVKNRGAEFDWYKCLDPVSKVRRRWIVCGIGIAYRYHGLEIDDLPFADEAKRLPDWLIRKIEREWADATPLQSLHTCLKDPKMFFKQLRKRFPPNAVQATVEMDGSFDSPTRLHYQLGSIFKRTLPSIRGIVGKLFYWPPEEQ